MRVYICVFFFTLPNTVLTEGCYDFVFIFPTPNKIPLLWDSNGRKFNYQHGFVYSATTGNVAIDFGAKCFH